VASHRLPEASPQDAAGAWGQRLGPRSILARYLADLAFLLLAFSLARWLRITLPLGKALDAEGAALHPPMVFLALVIWSVSLAAVRAYHPTHHRDAIAEMQAIAAAVTVAALVYAGLLYLSYRGLSRLLFGYLYLLDLGLTAGAHLLWRTIARRWGAGKRRMAVVGVTPAAREVAAGIRRAGADRVTLLGYVVEGNADGQPTELELPVLGELAEIAALVERHGIDELVIPAARPTAEMEDVLATLQPLSVSLTVVPQTADLILSRAQAEPLGDLVLITLNAPAIGPLDRVLKRMLDLVAAVLGLLFLAPLLGLIAILVWLDSGRPVFYLSTRLGEGERPFRMIKFRTMLPDADQQEGDLVQIDAQGQVDFVKSPDDPRITAVGRFLRRWSLDELPQLLNVLRGEMSLVGPRPELPELAAHYAPWQRRRFGVPQGMTGWWQVSGRSDRPKALHVEDDLHYIRNYSLMLDIGILWRTVGTVLRGRGAY